MFKRSHEISLNRVHDSVTFRESDDKLTLKVYGDPMRLTSGLMHVQRNMQGLTDDSPEDEQNAMAKELATVIFGPQQAEQLMEFYHNDAPGVMNVCLQYFKQRLSAKIVKAQKKNAPKK
jgi:hypothetical protein